MLDSVAIYLAAYKARGYDFVKVHNEDPVILDSVLVAAKRIGIPVAGHVPPPVRVEHVLPLGYKSIEHSFTDYLWNNRKEWNSHDTTGFGALAGALRKAGVWHCPTQSHYDRLHNHPPGLLKIEEDSGVKLLTGTDELPWLGVITRELQAFVAEGITPYNALLASTRNPAAFFGTLDQSGTIAVGKRADMVLLTGNPLKDVRYTAQPAGVMIGGRWLAREEIDRRLATLTFPTFNPGEGVKNNAPVKSYWNNMVDEIVEITAPLFYDIALDSTQQTKFKTLRTGYRAQRKVFIDSLGMSDQYVVGTQRVLHRIAHELGELRMELRPEQRATFDQKAKEWLQLHRTDGYSMDIPGVQ